MRSECEVKEEGERGTCEGGIISDGEEETVLWAVWEDTFREPFSFQSPVSVQMLLKESESETKGEQAGGVLL